MRNCLLLLHEHSRLNKYETIVGSSLKLHWLQEIENNIHLFEIPSVLNHINSVLVFILLGIGLLYSFKVTVKTIKLQKFNNGLYLIPILYGSIFFIMLTIWKFL